MTGALPADPRGRVTGWLVGIFILASWLVLGSASPTLILPADLDNADATSGISLPLARIHSTSGTVWRAPAASEKPASGPGVAAFDLPGDFSSVALRKHEIVLAQDVRLPGSPATAFQSRAPPVSLG